MPPREARLAPAMFSSLDRLFALLKRWHNQLQDWSISGRLESAAIQALQLDGKQPELARLLRSLSRKEFQELPTVQLLPGSSMSGAVGAYADNVIYLNEDWFRNATDRQVFLVLN